MELRNANSNGGNVVINNVHLMFQFLQKILKFELNKGILSWF